MIMDNNNSNNNNSNKPNNKVNMPKFNLNWMYMIIALMLLGLWWGSDSKGAGSKAVTYSEFQDYVKKGYVRTASLMQSTDSEMQNGWQWIIPMYSYMSFCRK